MTRVLSLRGGGIRGYATAILLAELERVLKQPLSEVFELIAGTSVGGIMATGLALQVPAAQLVEFFEVEGPLIFKGRTFGRFLLMLGHPRYQTKNLIAALERHFDVEGVQSLLAHTFTKLMVTSTRYRGLEARIWKSWKHTDMRTVLVAASSAAAPTYFDPVEIADFAHCDGGLCANNPAAIAVAEAKKLWPSHDVAVVDIACPNDKSQFEPKHGGILDFVPHMADTFIGSGEDVMGYLAQCLVGGAGSVLSIQPRLGDADHDIGNTSARNLRELKKCAHDGLERNVDNILKAIGK